MGAETTGGVRHGNEVAFPFAFIGLAKEQKKEAVSLVRVERIYCGPKSAEEAVAVAILADRKRKLEVSSHAEAYEDGRTA